MTVRIGHKYYLAAPGQVIPTTIAASWAEHQEENEYDEHQSYASAEEFLASPKLFPEWVRQAHESYRSALRDAGRILSIGSGIGEHDALLHVAGYDVISTDPIAGVNVVTRRLFPRMAFGELDALDPVAIERFSCDSVLVTGLDYALDDQQLDRLFANARGMLDRSRHPNRRFVFTLRYRDNRLTWLVDRVMLPLEARMRLLMSRTPARLVKKAHGHRRSRREIVAVARRHRFDVAATYYAGFGMEARRSALLRRIPLLAPLDRRVHVASSCVIFELVPR